MFAVCLQLERVVDFFLTRLTLERVVEDEILCVFAMGDSFVKSETCLVACSISAFAAYVLAGVFSYYYDFRSSGHSYLYI